MGKRHRPLVSIEDVRAFAENNDLPYFKGVELVKRTPQDFGLINWECNFTLPDNWMKKIYREYVYIDTDICDPDSRMEKFTPEKLKILNEHVRQLRMRATTWSEPQVDDLKEVLDVEPLEESFILSDRERRQRANGGPLVELNSDNIAVCLKHKIQPENVIVRLALAKMCFLDSKEEKRFKDLIRDEEFMQFLDRQVESYMKNAPAQ